MTRLGIGSGPCGAVAAGFGLILFFAGIGAGCLVSGRSSAGAQPPTHVGQVAPPPTSPPPSVRPTTAAGCRACNGVWATHGLAVEESCNCRTTDGGRRCRDGGDCQGLCIAAEEPEREVVDPGPPPRGYFVGRCSDLVTVFGCNRLIDRDAAAHGPMPLVDPPAPMCID